MRMQSLDEVYMNKLKDLYDAENQIVEALPKMAKAASSADLKETLQKHLDETKGQIARLDEVFEILGASAGNRQCVGMRGLLEEGEELLNGQEGGPALDAALIAAAQSVEHYEIAGYGSVQTWARELGQLEAADLLEETLEEEREADESLTEIAETIVNPDAGANEDIQDNPELIDDSDDESINQAEEA